MQCASAFRERKKRGHGLLGEQEANLQRISREKQERLRRILGDLEKHMTEINAMKEKLRERRVSFFSGKGEALLEEIKVPPLKILKEKDS